MQLAYVMTEERGETDRLLSALANELDARGIRAVGIVQTNVECYDSALCDMDVRVLPGDHVIRISQSLGEGSKGCRLNPEALEEAVGLVTQSLDVNAPQVLIVNKFGKHEAFGRGMRPVIGEALGRGLPVVSGVNGMNLEAFQSFSEGMAEEIEGRLKPILSWIEAAVSRSQDS